MELIATASSHFSRKIRLLLDLYAIDYSVVDIGNVAERDAAKFRDNPLMQVPVLIDGEQWLMDSDNICGYIVDKFDADDKYQFHISSVFDLNARAIMNGIMAEEVKVILGKRTGVPIEEYTFFQKAYDVINNGMAWLEANADKFSATAPTYRELHLLCAWDHFDYYETVELNYPKLGAIVDELSKQPLISQSKPHVLKPK